MRGQVVFSFNLLILKRGVGIKLPFSYNRGNGRQLIEQIIAM